MGDHVAMVRVTVAATPVEARQGNGVNDECIRLVSKRRIINRERKLSRRLVGFVLVWRLL